MPITVLLSDTGLPRKWLGSSAYSDLGLETNASFENQEWVRFREDRASPYNNRPLDFVTAANDGIKSLDHNSPVYREASIECKKQVDTGPGVASP